MKKIYLLLILLLFSLSAKPQCYEDTTKKYVDNIYPFLCGVDSLPNIYYKIIPYKYEENIEKFKNKKEIDVLIEISIDNYIYNGMIGYLELFLANNKLYYVKFTCNKINYFYYTYDSELFNLYIIYWDVDENLNWF